MSERTLSDWHDLLERFRKGFADEVVSGIGIRWSAPGIPHANIPAECIVAALVTAAWELLGERGYHTGGFPDARSVWHNNAFLSCGKWYKGDDSCGEADRFHGDTAALVGLLESFKPDTEKEVPSYVDDGWPRLKSDCYTEEWQERQDMKAALLELRDRLAALEAAQEGFAEQISNLAYNTNAAEEALGRRVEKLEAKGKKAASGTMPLASIRDWKSVRDAASKSNQHRACVARCLVEVVSRIAALEAKQ